MIAFPAGAKVWIAGGATDMRGGMNSLALKVQQGLGRDPHSHEVFCFRGRKGDRQSFHIQRTGLADRVSVASAFWPGAARP